MSKLVGLNFTRNDLSADHRYKYRILDASHVDQVVTLFTHAFCDSEPMTHYLNMQYEPYAEFARAVTEEAVKDGFSIVALDGDKVIACALCEDIADIHPVPITFDPNFKYIIGLLDGLGARFFPNKQFEKKYIMHLFITAVDKAYRHLGLSTQVNFRAMDVAAQKGFKFVYCELTNVYNEKGIMDHLKNKKRLIGTTVYHDFIYEDIKPFAHLDGGATSYLWEIAGDSRLSFKIDNKHDSEEISSVK